MRLKRTLDAIKLVFASIYSPVARGYFEAVNFNLEDEKMAVIIQEVVGNKFENTFYPHISGVAQSYNYYPFAHMNPKKVLQLLPSASGNTLLKAIKLIVSHQNIRQRKLILQKINLKIRN